MTIHFPTPYGVEFESEKNASLKALGLSKSKIKQHLREGTTRKTRKSARREIKKITDAAANYNEIAEQGIGAQDKMAKRRIGATEYYREFKVENGIRREAHKPSLFQTTMITQTALLAEGGLTAILMLADGKMDLMQGLAYGVSVSAINIALGLVSGFFCYRNLSYRADAPSPHNRDKKIRCLALGGAGLSASVMAVLHGAAARVRALGEHHGIFDFSNVSLTDTFNDYYAIAIIVVGTIGSILAVYKGWTGLSDPVPGFLAAREEAETRVNEAAENLYEDYLDLLEDILDCDLNALEDIQDRLEETSEDGASTNFNLAESIDTHNATVVADKSRLADLAREEHAKREYIAGHSLAEAEPDLSAFDQLKIITSADIKSGEDETETALGEAESAITHVKTKHGQAIAKVREAYAAFLADVPEFDFSLGKGE